MIHFKRSWLDFTAYKSYKYGTFNLGIRLFQRLFLQVKLGDWEQNLRQIEDQQDGRAEQILTGGAKALIPIAVQTDKCTHTWQNESKTGDKLTWEQADEIRRGHYNGNFQPLANAAEKKEEK